jgi:hypothetical protein
MANSDDVKVREVRLLESYSTAYNRFMEATIHMTFRFRNLFSQKDDEARNLKRKIENHLNIAQQKYSHAKNEYEASLKKGAKKQEIEQKERTMQMYKEIFEKAKKHSESAKKLYQKIHGETNRVIWMNERQRNKLEKSKEEGNNFLKKAITALKEYRQ